MRWIGALRGGSGEGAVKRRAGTANGRGRLVRAASQGDRGLLLAGQADGQVLIPPPHLARIQPISCCAAVEPCAPAEPGALAHLVRVAAGRQGLRPSIQVPAACLLSRAPTPGVSTTRSAR